MMKENMETVQSVATMKRKFRLVLLKINLCVLRGLCVEISRLIV